MTTTTLTATPPTPAAPRRRTPLPLAVSAWAVPVLVVGQFALVAVVPVVVALVSALRRVRDRAVRGAAALVAVSYAIPLALWRLRPDGGPSLSKDLHPGFLALIVAASAVLLVTLARARRAPRAEH